MEGKQHICTKMVEVRKAITRMTKQKHSDQVKYKYAQVSDVLEPIRPVMDDLGVMFMITGEVPTHPEGFVRMYEQQTRNGARSMWIYESDLTVAFIDAETGESLESTTHLIAYNDDPAKAKGSAYTYGIKYFLFYYFMIPSDEDDPDARDYNRRGPGHEEPAKPVEVAIGEDAGETLYITAEAIGWNRKQVDYQVSTIFHKRVPELTQGEMASILGQFGKTAKNQARKTA